MRLLSVLYRLAYLKCANDRSARSIDRAALSMDPLLAQPSIDRGRVDRWRCANDGWS